MMGDEALRLIIGWCLGCILAGSRLSVCALYAHVSSRRVPQARECGWHSRSGRAARGCRLTIVFMMARRVDAHRADLADGLVEDWCRVEASSAPWERAAAWRPCRRASARVADRRLTRRAGCRRALPPLNPRDCPWCRRGCPGRGARSPSCAPASSGGRRRTPRSKRSTARRSGRRPGRR